MRGTFEKGSRVWFTSPDERGSLQGMVGDIAEAKIPEYLSIHHLGLLTNGVEDTTSPQAKAWDGFENYTLHEKDGITTWVAELRSGKPLPQEYSEYFRKTWPKAQELVKALAENKLLVVAADIRKPLREVWNAWTTPSHITQWNAASDTWHCPEAENQLENGGRFRSRMAAKDGSFQFDFEGHHESVTTPLAIHSRMSDGRAFMTLFFPSGDEGTQLIEAFEPEAENSIEMQTQGWQAIANNFKKYVETNR